MYRENLKEFHQKLTGILKYVGELKGILPETDGGPNRAEYTQKNADLHSEKIGSRLNRHGR